MAQLAASSQIWKICILLKTYVTWSTSGNPWATRETARAALFDYLDGWYHRCRRHSTLEYRTPYVHAQHLTRA
jgi:transposase InsO family protein